MNFDIDLLGGLGGALFGIAAFPSVYKALRTGNAVEVPAQTIALFWFACVTYFGWLFAKFGVHWPFFFGGLETCSWTVIGWYHYFPRPAKLVDNTIKGEDGLTDLERSKVEQYGG